MGDWNAVLDSDLDRSGARSGTYKPDVKPFRDFIDRSNLVDKFINEHPREAVWTWTNRGELDTVVRTRISKFSLDSLLVGS